MFTKDYRKIIKNVYYKKVQIKVNNFFIIT